MQHDDHIWLTVKGEAWAIRKIVRGCNYVDFHLWRGYEPDLEFTAVEVIDTDWSAYCAAALKLLEREAGRKLL